MSCGYTFAELQAHATVSPFNVALCDNQGVSYVALGWPIRYAIVIARSTTNLKPLPFFFSNIFPFSNKDCVQLSSCTICTYCISIQSFGEFYLNCPLKDVWALSGENVAAGDNLEWAGKGLSILCFCAPKATYLCSAFSSPRMLFSFKIITICGDSLIHNYTHCM